MGVPRRNAEELEATRLEAYRRWSSGEGYGTIAAAMTGPPHWCGGKSTAKDWVLAGYRIVHKSGDPMVRRRPQRDAVGETLREYRVRLAEDVHAGRLARDAAYRLELEAIRLYVHTLGLRRAPEAAKVRVRSEGRPAALDPDLLAALAALSTDELFPPDEGDPAP